jgi:hypothetical protein
MLRTIPLFISHSWKYGEHYEKLIEFMENRKYFNFQDHSIPKSDPIHHADNDEQLYKAIGRRMSKVDIVIILAGVYATHSKWIGKEIEIAQKKQLPILAVCPRGQINLSATVTNSADKIVRWNTESLIDGIRNLIN